MGTRGIPVERRRGERAALKSEQCWFFLLPELGAQEIRATRVIFECVRRCFSDSSSHLRPSCGKYILARVVYARYDCLTGEDFCVSRDEQHSTPRIPVCFWCVSRLLSLSPRPALVALSPFAGEVCVLAYYLFCYYFGIYGSVRLLRPRHLRKTKGSFSHRDMDKLYGINSRSVFYFVDVAGYYDYLVVVAIAFFVCAELQLLS